MPDAIPDEVVERVRATGVEVAATSGTFNMAHPIRGCAPTACAAWR